LKAPEFWECLLLLNDEKEGILPGFPATSTRSTFECGFVGILDIGHDSLEKITIGVPHAVIREPTGPLLLLAVGVIGLVFVSAGHECLLMFLLLDDGRFQGLDAD